MPPVNQQGSRAALVTTLVITIVLLMVTLIMWIYTNTELTKAKSATDTLTTKYNAIASSSDMTEGGDAAAIQAVPKDKLPAGVGPSAVNVAAAEIRTLTNTINGKESTNFADATDEAAAAVAKAVAVMKDPTGKAPASGPAGAAMPAGASLVATLNQLSNSYAQLAQTAKDKDAALAGVKGDVDAKVKAWQDQLAALNTKLEEAQKQAADATNQVAELQKAYADKQTAADTGAQQQVAAAGTQVQQLQQDVAKGKSDLAAAQKKIADLVNKLNGKRADVKNATVRQADGNVIRVPSAGTCYINLGQGDHLPVGITFEVYDKGEGIPALGADPLSTNGMPVGKASIEVTRVGQNSSECRIVHLAPGATISEGDLIANLVYDHNTAYNFVVFGVFDVDGNGVATPQEADVVKSLVTRWGGKVQDQVNANTDFVVMGVEPQVPALTKAEMDDPLLREKYEKAVADSKAYQDVLNKAAELHIPIMNQNRFMYYIGYYDQMKR